MKFPWSSTTEPFALQPGNYYVEITQSEEVNSKSSGSLMWNLTLKSLAFNCNLCHDRMMLEGGGLNISAAKLSALGFAKDEDVEAGHLLGKRFYVAVKETPAKDQYPRKLDVDINVKGTNCGYWKEKPGDVVVPTAPVEDAPF